MKQLKVFGCNWVLGVLVHDVSAGAIQFCHGIHAEAVRRDVQLRRRSGNNFFHKSSYDHDDYFLIFFSMCWYKRFWLAKSEKS